MTSGEYNLPIFISSTEYDLIDLRAELSKFLNDLGYRPILSSSDGFPDSTPKFEPWESCLPVIDSCFVIIVIISGRYGTALPWKNFKSFFKDRIISPTHAEYLYAQRKRKRILVFIRENVLNLYQSYRAALKDSGHNISIAKENLKKTMPTFIENLAVFDFINEIKISNPIPWIKSFRDVTEIKIEVQKKMLNDLVDHFLLKEKDVETIIKTFAVALNDLPKEKRINVMKKIGVTRKIIGNLNRELLDKLTEIEKELVKTKQKDTNIDILETNYLSNVSYDLRKPLTEIMGYSEILMEDNYEGSVKEIASYILSSGERIFSTLNLLLLSAQFETEKYEIKIEKLNLSELIESQIKKPIKYFPILNIIFEKINNQDIIIQSCKELISEIFEILLNYVVKSDESGKILISTNIKKRGNIKYGVFSVENNGIKTKEKKNKIYFDSFKQKNDVYRHLINGKDIDLKLINKILKLIDGEFTIENKEGIVSKYTIWLPLILKRIVK
jgi:signal transduction histidine kinase